MMVERRKEQRRKSNALLKKATEDIMKERQKDADDFAETMGRRAATAFVVFMLFFLIIWATGKNAGVL